MKKFFLSVVVTTFLCLSSVSALDLPTGYVSIYSLVATDTNVAPTELCPLNVASAASYQMFGPPSGWGALTNYDLTGYKQLVFKLTYTTITDARQIAVRFSINGGAKDPFNVTLPANSTTQTFSIPLEQYKATDGSLKLGGIVFYNGASHWSFTYDGTASDVAVSVDYIAITKADISTGLSSPITDNPDAIVTVFNLAGAIVRKDVKRSEATLRLNPGIYIINKNKVVVTKQ
jgi:hypothetical protein